MNNFDVFKLKKPSKFETMSNSANIRSSKLNINPFSGENVTRFIWISNPNNIDNIPANLKFPILLGLLKGKSASKISDVSYWVVYQKLLISSKYATCKKPNPKHFSILWHSLTSIGKWQETMFQLLVKLSFCHKIFFKISLSQLWYKTTYYFAPFIPIKFQATINITILHINHYKQSIFLKVTHLLHTSTFAKFEWDTLYKRDKGALNLTSCCSSAPLWFDFQRSVSIHDYTHKITKLLISQFYYMFWSILCQITSRWS